MTQYQLDQRRIGELLRNPNAARIRHVERGFASAGHPAIRPPHLPVLEYIDRERGSRITYLAAHANITAQAMGELVDYLAGHGYVERVPDPTDGRAKLVRLTAQGHALYAIAVRLVAELEAIWATRIGEHKMRQLKRLLAELWDAVQAGEPDALYTPANRGGP
jgi:DNA-binding MarR family transcriptional regulator